MPDQRRFFLHPIFLEDHIRIAMLKEMDFGSEDPDDGALYVQLGAGHKLIEGWHNLDYPAWDAALGMPYLNDEVSGIASYHTLDHIAKPIPLLAEIQRVLKPGGWFVNIVPHYASELWHSDLTHVSQFGTESWRSIFSTRHYDHAAVDGHTEWRFRIEFNMIMGFTERNTVLVTKLVKMP